MPGVRRRQTYTTEPLGLDAWEPVTAALDHALTRLDAAPVDDIGGSIETRCRSLAPLAGGFDRAGVPPGLTITGQLLARKLTPDVLARWLQAALVGAPELCAYMAVFYRPQSESGGLDLPADAYETVGVDVRERVVAPAISERVDSIALSVYWGSRALCEAGLVSLVRASRLPLRVTSVGDEFRYHTTVPTAAGPSGTVVEPHVDFSAKLDLPVGRACPEEVAALTWRLVDERGAGVITGCYWLVSLHGDTAAKLRRLIALDLPADRYEVVGHLGFISPKSAGELLVALADQGKLVCTIGAALLADGRRLLVHVVGNARRYRVSASCKGGLTSHELTALLPLPVPWPE